MVSFIVNFVCLVGLPLFFIVGFIYPLFVASVHRYMDPHTREVDARARQRRLAEKSAKDRMAEAPKKK